MPYRIMKISRKGIDSMAPGYNFHLAQYFASRRLNAGNLESLSSFPSLNLESLQKAYSIAMNPMNMWTPKAISRPLIQF